MLHILSDCLNRADLFVETEAYVTFKAWVMGVVVVLLIISIIRYRG